MEDIRDEEILAKVARGDQGAQRDFFLRHRQGAYRAAYRLLGNDADALDAVSEAFVRAFRGAKTFKGRASARTWFYRIVVNTSLDLQRQRRRAVSIEAADEESLGLSDVLAADEETPLETAGRGELSTKIREAIARLDEKHRTVFVLAAVQEMSYKEIAETLDISIGTVMSRLFYARKYLQRSLANYLRK